MSKRLWMLVAALVLISGLCITAVKAGEKKIKMAGIIFQDDQFFRLVLFGMRDAAKEKGIELLEGNSNNKPDKEVELVNNYIINKVDAILISPISRKASVQALKNADKKGIKIVIHNTGCDFEAPYLESSPYSLGEATGKAARKFILEKLDGKAKIATLAFLSQVPEQSTARRNGFVDQLKDLPGVEFVAEQDAWLPEMAVKKAGDIMTANPDVNIIWAANEGGTVGSTLAVKNANKAGKVFVFGTDASEQMLEQLQSSDNILQAITAQAPFETGRRAVEYALMLIEGKEPPKTTIMDAVPLSRDDMDGVKNYEKTLKERMSQNK